eukprot:g14176.t1
MAQVVAPGGSQTSRASRGPRGKKQPTDYKMVRTFVEIFDDEEDSDAEELAHNLPKTKSVPANATRMGHRMASTSSSSGMGGNTNGAEKKKAEQKGQNYYSYAGDVGLTSRKMSQNIASAPPMRVIQSQGGAGASSGGGIQSFHPMERTRTGSPQMVTAFPQTLPPEYHLPYHHSQMLPGLVYDHTGAAFLQMGLHPGMNYQPPPATPAMVQPINYIMPPPPQPMTPTTPAEHHLASLGYPMLGLPTTAAQNLQQQNLHQDGAGGFVQRGRDAEAATSSDSPRTTPGSKPSGGGSTAIWPIIGTWERHVKPAKMVTPEGMEWVQQRLIWHQESLRMGRLEDEAGIFIKGRAYDDLLSTLSEDRIRHGNRHRYCIRFREKVDGTNENGFSMADGIGFVFSNKLPCAKNIQRIQSIFVSRKGIVCVRRKADVTRCKEFTVRAFEHGDFIWCEIDLTVGTAAFWVEGAETQGRTHGPPKGTVFYYGDCFPQFAQQKLDMGFITAVIKFEGVAADAICYQTLVPKGTAGANKAPLPE